MEWNAFAFFAVKVNIGCAVITCGTQADLIQMRLLNKFIKRNLMIRNGMVSNKSLCINQFFRFGTKKFGQHFLGTRLKSRF